MNPELSKDINESLNYLHQAHYRQPNIDDKYSEKLLYNYLEVLDPSKMFFTRKDIAKFEKHRLKLDDYLKKRNAEIAFDIFKQYRKRVSERAELAAKLIQSDFDFARDESLNIDPDTIEWAKNEKQIKERWRKRIKSDFIQQIMRETPADEVRDNLFRRYQRQRDVTYQLKADDVFELFMNSLTKETGPHTQYMSHATAENFRISMSLSLEGIGAVLRTDQDYTVIERLVEGGPAKQSGAIKPEDKIVAVAQAGEEKINVIGWRLRDVVQMIRGDKGTKLMLDIVSGDDPPGSPPRTVELVRDVIKLEEQAAKLSEVNVGKDKFSVISIPSFYSNAGSAKSIEEYTATTFDVKKLLEQVKKSDSKGLVIDLRNNSGGYLDEAISLSGLFIDKGPVVQIAARNGKRSVKSDKDGKTHYNGPLIVLINRYSASASEIFAAAMQDYGRAIIVGERSFGKGTVQRVAPLRYGNSVQHESQLKFTSAQFFRINGQSTQYEGVIPDITLNAGIEDDEFGERAYDNALPNTKIKAANYQSQAFSDDLRKQLKIQHQVRSETSPAFKFLRRNSQRVYENKNIKQLSLNLKERKAIKKQQEEASLAQLNEYRASLGLPAVTQETKKDNPLPNEDDHWQIVFQQETANILADQLKWHKSVIASKSANKSKTQ